ncbi:S8 family serine peptidase [Nitratireductor luteus]|uniref:S8 family serine peptidase n=1 Tax=Nitratireductor luteus TaxID=2976980 RepID=UPI00223F76AC|nr:S8 family serine peptidase [Nitratireductor luteus]
MKPSAFLLGTILALTAGLASAQTNAPAVTRPVPQDCADDQSRPGCRGAEEDARQPGVVYLPPLLAELFGRSPGSVGPGGDLPKRPSTPPANDGQTNDASSASPSDSPNGGSPTQAGAAPANGFAPSRRAPAASVPPRAVVGDHVPDEVLVTIDGDVAAAEAIAAALGLEVRSSRASALLDTTVARYGIPDGRPVGVVLAQLVADGRTLGQAPNHIYTLEQAGQLVPYAFERIALNAEQASGADIDIAVIDTALDENHPALKEAVAGLFDAMPDRFIEERGHGTSISGLIAGGGPFRGLATGARIHHARAFEGGRSSMDVLLSALDWAVAQQVRIINMSFVGPKNLLFEAACRAARERGIVLVAAAGNNGPRAPYGYPAAYDGVIAVTATDAQDMLMEQANRGPYVELSAPGVKLLAPIPGGGMDAVTGTSFAAAVVSGAIANLMRAEGLDADEISARLAQTAIDLGAPGRDDDYGYGLVNAEAAGGR